MPGGRPRKVPGEEAVSITLTANAVALVDEAIEVLAADLILAGRPSPTAREFAAMRRGWIESLILGTLGPRARHPIAVRIDLPDLLRGLSGKDSEEARGWMRRETERLNDEAPPVVRAKFAANRAFHETLQAGREQEGEAEADKEG